MSHPDETPAIPSFDSGMEPNFAEPQALAGPSIEKPASCLDQDFDFQIVVFKVENTLFRVLRNGFNVPGTPFEAMFALPQAQTDSSVEGSCPENPIHLPGIKADHFRFFLRILYPFIDQTPIVEFDEWVGVLNLANMWVFQEIREKAINELSNLISEKTAMERIALAREYRVAEWLRDAYVELAQKTPLNFEELRPAEPCSNNPVDTSDWEANSKKWEAISREWETLARISQVQTKVANSGITVNGNCKVQVCSQCGGILGYSNRCTTVKCRVLAITAVVDETFRGEFESLKENPEHVEPPLPSNGTRSAAPPKKRKRKKRAY